MRQLVAQLGVGIRDDGFVSADDLGLNRGDGCFDATLVRVDGGRVTADFVELHLERLTASARILEMPAPDLDAWRALIDDALVAWAERGGGEAVLKLVYTRGNESVPGPPLGLLTITDFHASRAAAVAATMSAGRTVDALNDAPWLLGGAKTLSYAVNMSYAREAARRGAGDAILVSTDGYVLEGPRAGVLVLRAGRLISTPPKEAAILDSITVRKALAGWQEQGGEAAYELFTVQDMLTADGVWLASSGRGIVPVASIDGVEIAQDQEATQQLRELVRP
ncbi:aminotransferase class IV [Tessaracoccus caeni]|uniref:aminotransferase class IV n=1 Tax=Tessaracoccus caeni TaxID=3031239 RepID=UPI0023DA57CA|nr:aminotransferase class IV [Tessaracoccus caeni]MDF1487633.1 aminotransferase class IV [Tessaracoccus caeni]